MKRRVLFFLCVLLSILFAIYYLIVKARPEVLVARAVIGDIRDSVTGNVKVYPSATFELKSEANAKVDWVEVLPLGETLFVEQNQTLIRLSNDDLKLRQKRLELDKNQLLERNQAGSVTELLLDIKNVDLLASKELVAKEKISVFEFDSKQNEVSRINTQFEHEKLAETHFLQNWELSSKSLLADFEKRIIRSPIKGLFTACFVAPGNHVFHGNLVAKVESSDRLIEVTLNEEEFDGIKTGLKAGVTFFSMKNIIHDANVTALSHAVDSNSGTRKIYLSLNSDNISIPVGSAGRAEIIKSVKKDVILVPRRALVGNFVVVEKNGKALFRNVEVGSTNLKTAEIINGLKVGEKVVVDMPHLLRDGERLDTRIVGF